MNSVSIDDIQDRLRKLPPEKLSVIYDFVSYVADRYQDLALDTMIASEGVLARDWNCAEEDEAWADL
jgi:hypothetical protein